MSARRLLTTVAAAALAALALPGAASGAAKPSRDVQLQLLAINDFHGALQEPTGSGGRVTPSPDSTATVDAGGAKFLATHVRRLEATNPNTLVVGAGDLIGASPLVSAIFQDEPTIEALNLIGLDLTAVGNHEFDDGIGELLRMIRGGCHPTKGCFGGDGFEGADFRYLGANVVRTATGRPEILPFAIRRFGGVKVGFIGMTLEGTPSIVSPAGIAGLEFQDEAEVANRYARLLRSRFGVKAIVVLLHEGATQLERPNGINTCRGISGPVIDIVSRTTKAVDLFITGHTHQAYTCVIDGRPVTSALSNGRLVTDIDVTLSRRTRDVKAVATNNEVVTRNVPADADVAALVDRYAALSEPLAARVVGRQSAAILRTADDSGESPAGNLIADAMLAATRAGEQGGAVAAFMNAGGVRADFPAASSPDPITFGEAFSVQPFGNNLVTLTLTGAQLELLLAQQWCGQTGNPAQARIMQPSANVAYTWSTAAAAAALGQPCGSVASPVSGLTIDGQPVDAARSYRITVNSFMADGGDDFRVLVEGTDRLGGVIDLDALEAYLAPSIEGAPIDPPATDRIAVVP
jgi:5'-nucleotidase